MHLQNDSLPFLTLASRFTTFWLGHALKSKFFYVLRHFNFWFFFRLSFFSFSFLFAAVIDFLPGLLAVKKLPRKRHREGQFLRWSSQVQWQEILLWVFHSTFWAFLCIAWAPFGQSPWSGHHWKDVFLLLSIDDANFGQKGWRQKWKKGRGSSRPVTSASGVNGLICALICYIKMLRLKSPYNAWQNLEHPVHYVCLWTVSFVMHRLLIHV